MRTFGAALLVFMGVVLVPTAARAQASITGVVKDASGAVLPGVTVEAASPALIEKVAIGGHRRERSVPRSSTCGPAPIR